ncbi:restriction endonuclease subunit S [Salsuginibacillus halophilus]|uniref:restriction endonuclease subunit S n=1 Tax=Salsuginibacillus halophilus TaxID=517424 RepID=UPI0015E65E97|nr:restriction endonuclease subunit S [Salsuginibacillus halophilus]
MDSTQHTWLFKTFDSICEVRQEKFNPNKNPEHPYIGLEHIESGSGVINSIGSSTDTSSMKNVFKEGDVLFGKLRPYLQKYWLANFDGVCATEILPLIAKNNIDNRYLFYLVQKGSFIRYLSNRAFGTRMPRTSWGEMSEYETLVPIRIVEQQKIAAILSSVDEAIEKTEQIIEQTETVKKGLMQQLFKRGINDFKLKKTSIGDIPCDWTLTNIDSIATVTKLAGFEFTEHIEYVNSGDIIAVRGLNIKEGRLKLDEVKKIYKDVSDKLTRSKLYYNDLVFTYVGTIGEVAIIKEEDQYHLAPNVAKLTLNEGTPDYLYYYLRSPIALKEINSLLTTTSQPALSMGNIRKIRVPLPSSEEQARIYKIIESVDDKMHFYKKKLEKLMKLKQGLMQQLLTGKVRVPIDEDEEVLP